MHPRVELVRSWEFDHLGRMITAIERRGGGYEVTQAAYYGGRRRQASDPEDAEMLAATMGGVGVPRRCV